MEGTSSQNIPYKFDLNEDVVGENCDEIEGTTKEVILGSPKSSEEKPYAGMLFESTNEALELYNAFAMVRGFSVRKGQVRKFKWDGTVQRITYVCWKRRLSS